MEITKWHGRKFKYFLLKTAGGILFTGAVALLTHQEKEPDIRAISPAFFTWILFKMGLNLT